MHPWNRPQEPEELRTQCVALTRAFMKEKRVTCKTPSCKWPQVKSVAGETMTLQTLLSDHTGQHCNYCDSLMGHSSRDTIDHFLPKTYFPQLAYVWSNLYVCCDGCQRKSTRYDEQALRPDESGYSFSRYFRYHRNGQISAIATDTTDRKRAEITITVLKLNQVKLVRDRSKAFRVHLTPRMRPLRPGLDARNASFRFDSQRFSYEDKPFRAFFAQDPVD